MRWDWRWSVGPERGGKGLQWPLWGRGERLTAFRVWLGSDVLLQGWSLCPNAWLLVLQTSVIYLHTKHPITQLFSCFSKSCRYFSLVLRTRAQIPHVGNQGSQKLGEPIYLALVYLKCHLFSLPHAQIQPLKSSLLKPICFLEAFPSLIVQSTVSDLASPQPFTHSR